MNTRQLFDTPKGASSCGAVLINGKLFENNSYESFHRRRIHWTIEKLRSFCAQEILEVGGHPWAMTARLTDERGMRVLGTVSAEEVTNWPEDIGVTSRRYTVQTTRGKKSTFTNYSANVERTLFEINEHPDTVIACEIVEHLIRSPHVLFLNINRWLLTGGHLLVTTPNGAQFSNPFRCHSNQACYRSNVYARHHYLYTLDGLADLITLCGFEIVEMGHVNLYADRSGFPGIYDKLGRLPRKFFRERFRRTIYVIARKSHDVTKLIRIPFVYDQRGQWEHIGGGG